jgi:hypothetical protein
MYGVSARNLAYVNKVLGDTIFEGEVSILVFKLTLFL